MCLHQVNPFLPGQPAFHTEKTTYAEHDRYQKANRHRGDNWRYDENAKIEKVKAEGIPS